MFATSGLQTMPSGRDPDEPSYRLPPVHPAATATVVIAYHAVRGNRARRHHPDGGPRHRSADGVACRAGRDTLPARRIPSSSSLTAVAGHRRGWTWMSGSVSRRRLSALASAAVAWTAFGIRVAGRCTWSWSPRRPSPSLCPPLLLSGRSGPHGCQSSFWTGRWPDPTISALEIPGGG